MSENTNNTSEPEIKNIPVKNPMKGPPTKFLKKMGFVKKEGGGMQLEKGVNIEKGINVEKGGFVQPKKVLNPSKFKKPPIATKRKLTDTPVRPMPKRPGNTTTEENSTSNENDTNKTNEEQTEDSNNNNEENLKQEESNNNSENNSENVTPELQEKEIEKIKNEENVSGELNNNNTDTNTPNNENTSNNENNNSNDTTNNTTINNNNNTRTTPYTNTSSNDSSTQSQDDSSPKTDQITNSSHSSSTELTKSISSESLNNNKSNTTTLSSSPNVEQPKPKIVIKTLENLDSPNKRNSLDSSDRIPNDTITETNTDDTSENEDLIETREIRSNTNTSEDSIDEDKKHSVSHSNEVLQSMLINSFIPYNSANKIIPLYIIEISTTVRKIKSKRTYQQFQKLDQDMKKYDVVKQLPKLPGNGKTFVVTETKNSDIVERCKQLQGYLQAILDNPNFSYREEVKGFLGMEVNDQPTQITPKKESTISIKSRASVSVVKSVPVQNFERSLNKTISMEVQNWLQQIYVSLMQKGSIFERIEKNKPYFACLRLSQDKKNLETGRTAKNCDTQNIKLSDFIPLSEIQEIRKENLKSSGKSSQNLKTTKSKLVLTSNQAPQYTLQIVQTGKKSTIDFQIDDSGTFYNWYFGLCSLLNKPIDDRKYQTQTRFMMEIESNLRLLDIDYDLIEKISKTPPTMPPPPQN